MPFLTAKLGRPSLLIVLLLALVAIAPVADSGAQQAIPQCQDGLDNDGDNAIDGVDAGCGPGSDDNEADSIYFIPPVTIPLPVVTIQATVTAKGVVEVSLFRVRALRGSTVDITCRGKACPFKKSTRTMITSTLRLTQLEGKLRPRMVLKLRIARPDELGKYLRYEVRKKKAPLREDLCVDQDTRKVRGCFAG